MKLIRAIPRIALLGAVALTATACATARPVAAGVDIEDPLADIEKTHTTASVGDGMIMMCKPASIADETPPAVTTSFSSTTRSRTIDPQYASSSA